VKYLNFYENKGGRVSRETKNRRRNVEGRKNVVCVARNYVFDRRPLNREAMGGFV